MVAVKLAEQPDQAGCRASRDAGLTWSLLCGAASTARAAAHCCPLPAHSLRIAAPVLMKMQLLRGRQGLPVWQEQSSIGRSMRHAEPPYDSLLSLEHRRDSLTVLLHTAGKAQRPRLPVA